jgi:Flp pilus assembly protein TadD
MSKQHLSDTVVVNHNLPLRRARWSATAVLAATFLGLTTVFVGNAVGFQKEEPEWPARADQSEDAQRKAMEAALEKIAAWQKQGRWAEARAGLEVLEVLLGDAGPAELRKRVAKARADLDLVMRLDTIRLGQATLVEGKLDTKMADRAYAAAFAEAGVGKEGDDEKEAAARIRASAIREKLIAALDEWVGMATDPKRVEWLLRVARQADPDDWRDRFRDSKVRGDRSAVESLAKELLKDEAKLRAQSPQLLAALGNALGGQRGDVVPLLTAAQRRYPDDFWLNFHLGNALLDAKKWEEAAGCYRAALAVRPETSAVYNNLGHALHSMGQLDEAIAVYRKAIEIDPKNLKAHLNLGHVLRAKKQLDEAIEVYRQVVRLDPTDVSAQGALGNVLVEKGMLEEALAVLRRTLELDPKDPKSHRNLGNALKAKGLLDEALAEYKKAIALDPKDAASHNDLGLALSDKGQLDEAIAEYRKALELDPKYARAYFNLGNALKAKGQKDEAAAAFRKAADLDPALRRER